jgi:membrane protein YdbS with pleckstrin-like domain
MTHNSQKELQKASLVGRILSIEAFLILMGIALLVYGIANSATMVIFWACVIIPGVIILHLVRRKNWAKHWEEMEAEHKLREEYDARRKVAADEARKGTDGK